MDVGTEILSDIIVFSKYAKHDPVVQRRETWQEIVTRYEVMMIKKYPTLKNEITQNVEYIRQYMVLPSMRALQFAGAAMEVNNARGYNCAYLPVDSIYSFSETMFLLLGGSGVGYSVQQRHISSLPPIKRPTKTRRYLIEDSIIGWADAVKVLMKAYLGNSTMPDFDFRAIRPKGARLVTAGGKAPGPEPLKTCLFHVQAILDRKKDGERLTSLECHDIMCHIANSVLAGGIRRSAMIALFDKDDEQMLACKFGNWWELNEQRGRANNSAVLKRGEVTQEEFIDIWTKVEISKSGEPGVYWTNDFEWGTNPCCEIALRAFQFCNLCEINASTVQSQEDLDNRARVAAFFGTLQAGFTDFHYLRPIWKKTTEAEALVGVGMTGICSGEVLKYDLQEASQTAIHENIRVAKLIGINRAARVTCVKPSGTTSCVLGTSSGIHGWFDHYYLRTIRFSKTEEIAQYLMNNHPELCEDDMLRKDTLCVRIPIQAPQGAIYRTEAALETLSRVKRFSTEWIKPGHRLGVNTHNVSCTVNLRDAEWDKVGKWMWENRDVYNGIAVLPYDGGSYVQAPLESITQEQYLEKVKALKHIDLTKVIELDDNVNFSQESACAGGACEIQAA